MLHFLGFTGGWFLMLLSLMLQWVWVSVALVLLFSVKYQTHSLILIGLLIDGYFGMFYQLPIFSLLAILWFVFFETFRDKLNIAQE